VNGLILKNRLVMGPMGNINMAEEMGRPAAKMIEYFSERARGGVGLITSGLVPTSQGIDPTTTESGDRSLFPRLDRSRTVLAGWRILAERIHDWGAHFFIQLTPGLGRVGSPEVLLKKARLPVSSWWNPNFYLPSVPCRPLTGAECLRIIRHTAQAAADAEALGIDGIYLHGHEGYLLEQMSNPAFNRRPLGPFRNWRHFALTLVEEVRRRIQPSYPVMYRIDLSLALRASYGEKMDTIPGLRMFRRERGIAETLDFLAELAATGVDLVDVDLGGYDNWWLPHPPDSMPPGCYLPVARLVKEHFAAHNIKSKAGFEIPVVAVGKLGDPDLAEEALRRGDCDMVMLARPLLADPDWPRKAYAGRVSEIRPCIGDQEGCLNEFLKGGHPQCAVNPRAGFEEALPPDPLRLPRRQRKRVGIVGAGPAGILCALTAARRGHHVTLWEKANRLGGMLVPATMPRLKIDLAGYLAWLERQLASCSHHCKLEVRLGMEATPEILRVEEYESLVLATGGKPIAPNLPGLKSPPVFQGIEMLMNPSLIDGAQRVLVVGGGAMGCEIAHYLATERTCQVIVAEALPFFMAGMCTATRGHLLHILEGLGVRLLNCSRLLQAEDGFVILERNVSPSVPNPFNTWNPLLPANIPNPLARRMQVKLERQTIEVDRVLLALGFDPDETLYRACQERLVAPEIQRIGDSFQVGRVFQAVKAGYRVGLAI
jgi:2-enoate reductase